MEISNQKSDRQEKGKRKTPPVRRQGEFGCPELFPVIQLGFVQTDIGCLEYRVFHSGIQLFAVIVHHCNGRAVQGQDGRMLIRHMKAMQISATAQALSMDMPAPTKITSTASSRKPFMKPALGVFFPFR